MDNNDYRGQMDMDMGEATNIGRQCTLFSKRPKRRSADLCHRIDRYRSSDAWQDFADLKGK